MFQVCETGGKATRKFSDGGGGKPGPKSSKPGQPVPFRLTSPEGVGRTKLPMGIIGQYGEEPPEGYSVLLAGEWRGTPNPISIDTYFHFLASPSPDSPATAALAAKCNEEREATIREAVL